MSKQLFEIKHKITGAVLYSSKEDSLKDTVVKAVQDKIHLSHANLSFADLPGADLYRADLSGADLHRADLSGATLSAADLSNANLSHANLSGATLFFADLSSATLHRADLSGATLSFADLSGADLYRADLSGIKGLNKYSTTPLYSMLDQPGKIHAYKLVNKRNEGIYQGGLIYTIGEIIKENNYNDNEYEKCGAGINLATLDWCIKGYQSGYKILICEFTKEDIVAIPIGSDGKFRVKQCKVIGEKDLTEIGLK